MPNKTIRLTRLLIVFRANSSYWYDDPFVYHSAPLLAQGSLEPESSTGYTALC